MLSPPLVREKMQKCRHCRKWELGQVNSDGEQRWFIEEVQAHRETAGCSQNVSLRVRWFWIQIHTQNFSWSLILGECSLNLSFIHLLSDDTNLYPVDCVYILNWIIFTEGFPSGSVVKNPPANAGDTGDVDSIPESGKFPGEGHDNPPQYSYLKDPMGRGAWWATVHGVAKSWRQLNGYTHTQYLQM